VLSGHELPQQHVGIDALAQPKDAGNLGGWGKNPPKIGPSWLDV